MDIPSITAALTGIKTALDIIKSTQKVIKQAEVGSKITELQSIVSSIFANLIDAQSMIQKLYEENSQLKRKLESIQNWDEDKDKYQLVKLITGTVVYKLNNPKNQTENDMLFCPNCYQLKEISIIQPTRPTHTYHCPSCNNNYRIKRHGDKTITIVEDNS